MTCKRSLAASILLILCLSVGSVFANTMQPVNTTDPLSLLVNAYQKQLSATSLAVQSDVKTTVSAVSEGVSLQFSADLDIDTAIRKPGEIYLRVELPKAFMPLLPDQAQLEVYIKENTLYAKLPGGLWEQNDLGQEIPDLGAMNQLITTEVINLLKKAQLELTCQETVEDGKRYFDITGIVYGEKLYNALRERLLELSVFYPLPPDALEQLDLMVAPTMKTLQTNFTCRIDAVTYEMVKAHSEIAMTLDLEQLSPSSAAKFGLQMVIDANYLYGDAVQMPVITPEMIAPSEPDIEVPGDNKLEQPAPEAPETDSTTII